MITIQGLTPLQQEILAELWSRDTDLEIKQYLRTLPRSLLRQAQILHYMIILAALDDVTEITDETLDIIDRCR